MTDPDQTLKELMEIGEQLRANWDKNELIRRWEWAGLICEIWFVRSDHYCAYVQLPWYHPAHGKGYGEDELYDVEVHGGLTFAGTLNDDDYWWVGFDCAHSGDWTQLHPSLGAHRWTVDEVVAETQQLADQLGMPNEDEVPL